MKFKVFIIIAVFAAVTASCGSGKTVKPQDTTADLDEGRIKEICEEHEVECGDFLATVNGSLKALFCGECEEGFVCDDVTNKCKNESDTDEPADDSDGPDDDADIQEDDSDNQPQEAETREKACTGLPENAEWNIVSEITQTFDGENWLPSEKAVFNSESSTERCRFICKEGYVWNSEDCVSYTPSDLPDCGSEEFPCEDKSTGMIWSRMMEKRMNWGNAKAYCQDFNENGYNDWHLPNVDEARTAIRNCSVLITGGTCRVSESEGCTSHTCMLDPDTDFESDAVRDQCTCFTDDGSYNIFHEHNKLFWTSSFIPEYQQYAWVLSFASHSLEPADKEEIHFLHCVRSDYFLHDSHCDKHYTWDGSECTPDTKTTECKGLPENAIWNAVSSIIQTWEGTKWVPSEWATYNKNSSSSECRFKCYEEFTWDGNECVLE